MEGTTDNQPQDTVADGAVGEQMAATLKMRALLLSYYRAGRALQESIEPLIERDYGIDLRDYVVLIAIANGVRYPTDLADRLHLGKHTVTRVLRNLTEAGFVMTKADDLDSRRTRLAVSPAGELLKAAMVGKITELMTPALAGFTPGHVDLLIGALDELRERLVATRPSATRARQEEEQR